MSQEPFRIYVGWDSREDIAYQVCRHSLLRHASIPVSVIPLRQKELRAQGLYDRPADPLAATQFTYSRFLVPHLAGYRGWALYCDCDFLWLADIAALVALADARYGAMCVHHDHRPSERMKMDGKTQTVYPRKNWSSLILYNCAHPATRQLTPEVVNRETGAYLHRFQWLDDTAIGSLPETWNWLEGWNTKPAEGHPAEGHPAEGHPAEGHPAEGHPNVIHYTRGGPWFDQWKAVDYADLWRAEASRLEKVGGAS